MVWYGYAFVRVCSELMKLANRVYLATRIQLIVTMWGLYLPVTSTIHIILTNRMRNFTE